MLPEFFRLNNGEKMPILGLGTYNQQSAGSAIYMLKKAIKLGYRHFDSALVYQNENLISTAITECIFEDSSLKRADFFITTKIFCHQLETAFETLNNALEFTKLEYFDLVLLHWPVCFRKDELEIGPQRDAGLKPCLDVFDLISSWSGLENLVKRKFVKSIGVCNVGLFSLQKLLRVCEIKPVVCQIELSLLCPQTEIMRFCMANDVQVVAAAPLNQMRNNADKVFDKFPIKRISEKYGLSCVQTMLSVLVTKGICVIPGSNRLEHLIENFFLMEISDVDLMQFPENGENLRCIDPVSFGPNRFL